MATVRIAKYRLSDDPQAIEREEAVRISRDLTLPFARALPGFLSYDLVEADDYFFAITRWRTREEAEAVAASHEAWRQANAPALPQPVEVHLGEVLISDDEA